MNRLNRKTVLRMTRAVRDSSCCERDRLMPSSMWPSWCMIACKGEEAEAAPSRRHPFSKWGEADAHLRATTTNRTEAGRGTGNCFGRGSVEGRVACAGSQTTLWSLRDWKNESVVARSGLKHTQCFKDHVQSPTRVGQTLTLPEAAKGPHSVTPLAQQFCTQTG